MAVTQNFSVKALNGKYLIDGVVAPNLELISGRTYEFDLSDPSLITHPLKFKEGGSLFEGSVRYDGTLGVDQVVTLTVPSMTDGVGLMSYYCTNHSGMGNDIEIKFNNIFGTNTDDVLTGLSGSDWIEGINGDDTIDGSTGQDHVDGGEGHDTLFGGADNDTLNGSDGDDTIDGGSGNDTLDGGAGNDSLLGGDGADTYVYRFEDGVTTITDTGENTLHAISRTTDGTRLFGEMYFDDEERLVIEGNEVTAPNSKLIATGITDLYWTADDNSYSPISTTIYNPSVHDLNDDLSFTFISTHQSNTITTNATDKYTDVYTGDGDDIISIAGSGESWVASGGGDDEVHGGSGNDIFFGDGVNNWQNMDNYGDDYLHGYEGDDELHGGEGNDTLHGGEGNDRLEGDAGNDYLFGGAGDDTLDGGAGDDTLDGGAGDDYLEDGFGSDEVYGGAGDDTFNNIGGSDLFDGGDGSDTLITDISTGFDERSFEIGFDTVAGTHGRLNSTVGQDTITGIENFTLKGNFNAVVTGGDEDNIFITDAGDDVLNGGAGDDRLSAWIGNDEVYAGAGNDTIINTGGEDLFDGGSGVDTLITDLSQSVKDRLGLSLDFDIVFDLTAEDPHMRHYAVTPDGTDYAWDEIYSIENYTLIGDFDVTLTGDDQANILVSDSGDDVLRGGDGDDRLSAWIGNDEVYAGAGNDTIINTGGEDLFDGGSGVDTLITDLSQSVKDRLGLSLDFDIVFDLTAEDPHMRHYAVTPDGTDYAWDEIYSIENYTLIGDFDVTLTGDDQANILVSDSGDDVLRGGAGNDTLDGGSGDDKLYGGAGNDTLIHSGSGAQLFDGGDGIDTYKKSAVQAGLSLEIEVNLETGYTGSVTDRDHPLQDIVTNIENVDFSLVDWDLSLIGDSSDNILTAGSGDDTLYGGAGDDTLDGGAGMIL